MGALDLVLEGGENSNRERNSREFSRQGRFQKHSCRNGSAQGAKIRQKGSNLGQFCHFQVMTSGA